MMTVVAVGLGMIAGAPAAAAGLAGTGGDSEALVAPGGVARAAALVLLAALASPSGGLTVSAGGYTTRCAPVDRIFYCLGLGWRNALPTAAELAFEPARAPASQGAAGAGKELARSEQAARSRQEIADAMKGVDDVLYYNYLSEGGAPAATVAAFPSLAALSGGVSPSAACPTIVAQGVTAAAACSIAIVGDPNKTMKQKNDWYCGPTSMAILGWNDPQVGSNTNYRNPDYWAPRRGTTQASGTAIVNINAQINAKLTGWKNLNGRAFQVVDIANWSQTTWAAMFRSHIGDARTPVQLHPDLSKLTYWTIGGGGGHFNVGRGYDFSSSSSAAWYVSIFEPAGGSSIAKVQTTTLGNLIYAHVNHPLHNISY